VIIWEDRLPDAKRNASKVIMNGNPAFKKGNLIDWNQSFSKRFPGGNILPKGICLMRFFVRIFFILANPIIPIVHHQKTMFYP
jgi:hypothetical protein